MGDITSPESAWFLEQIGMLRGRVDVLDARLTHIGDQLAGLVESLGELRRRLADATSTASGGDGRG